MKNINQIYSAIVTSSIFSKGNSALLIILSIIIIAQLIKHGNAALGIYMFVEKFLVRKHDHNNNGDGGSGGTNSSEDVVHIVSHSPSPSH